MSDTHDSGVSPVIATLIFVAIAVIGGSLIFVVSQGFFESTMRLDIEPKLSDDMVEGTTYDGERYTGEVLTTIQTRIDHHIMQSNERWDCVLYEQTFESYILCAGLGSIDDHPQEVIDDWNPYQVGETLDYQFNIDFESIVSLDPDLKNEITNHFNERITHADSYGITWNEEIDGTIIFWWQMK